MSEPLLACERVGRTFRSGSRSITVLDELDFSLRQGESVAIVGDSGVGKSTFLHLLGGLDRPDCGRVTIGGRDLPWDNSAEMASYRNRRIGFVFQFHHLLPEFSALENVEMPFRVAGRSETHAALELLDRLGLGERLEHTPGRLSGGEQQRVAIARAVVGRPDVVLADEPTGNLDPATGARVFDLLRELQRERGFALILATHSERLARGCDRVLRLTAGRLETLGEQATGAYFQHP